MIRQLLLAAVLPLILANCGANNQIPTPPPLADPSVHLLVQTGGDVNIKRAGWQTYAPALFGAILRTGDLLRLNGAAQAIVVCADLTVSRLQPGVAEVPCQAPAQPVLMYDDSRINRTRTIDNNQPAFPQLISPRQTSLLGDHPTIRWAAVGDVTSYQVELFQTSPRQSIWSAVTGQTTELVYPPDAPPLEPGVDYAITVTGGGHSSDDEKAVGSGFDLIDPADASAIRTAEATIRQLGLADEASALLIANLYASRHLNAEAISALEALLPRTHEPALARALGGLYAQIGIAHLAGARYRDALAASKLAGDIEGQALAQQALGEFAVARKDLATAAQFLNQASALYEQLGDKQTAAALKATAQRPQP